MINSKQYLCSISTEQLSKVINQCYVYIDEINKVCYILYPQRLNFIIYTTEYTDELTNLLKIKQLKYLSLIPIENYLQQKEDIHPVLKLELLYLL